MWYLNVRVYVYGCVCLFYISFDDSVDGGETVLLDLFPVLEELRERFPKLFQTLAEVPATFQKIHHDRCSSHLTASYFEIYTIRVSFKDTRVV